MNRQGRRAFLGTGLAAAAGVTAAACGMGGGDDDGMVIHLHGRLPVESTTPLQSQVDLTVAGSATNLSGSGRSFIELEDPARLVTTASTWSVTGTREGNRVRLKGITFQANNADILGSPVTVEFDVKTGETEWAMGPFLSGPIKSQTSRSKGRLSVAVREMELSGASGTSDGGTPGGTPGNMGAN